jgi:N-acetylglucosaminyl-diphospho-decaprenol L-rhamnosyltransferase
LQAGGRRLPPRPRDRRAARAGRLDGRLLAANRLTPHLAERTGTVFVAHARLDLVTRCLETLPELRRENTVVVLNAPETVDSVALDRLRVTATVVSPPAQQGYGANLNLGVRHLPPAVAWVLLANDDLEFAPESLARLVTTLEEHPSTAAVGPALVDSAGQPLPGLLTVPSAGPIALEFARLLPLGSAWSSLERRARGSASAAKWISGAAMLVRADAFRSVGGFDEAFFLYFEETDLCVRLHDGGWAVEWREDAPVVHLGGGSTGASDWRLFLQSRRLYLAKRIGGTRLLALQIALALVFVVGAAYNAAAAVLRPATARRRRELVREVWRWRPFLLGPRIAP